MAASNLIRTAREALGLTQAEFGAWLAERLGLPAPIPQPRIAEWERGKRTPRPRVRREAARVAAKAVAERLVREVARECGRHDLEFAGLPPDLRVIRDDLAELLEDLFA